MKRKFIISLSIVFTLLIAFELVFSNRYNILSLTNGLEEKTLSLESATVSGKVSLSADGTLRVTGSGQIFFHGIDQEVRYLTIDAYGSDKIANFSMDKTDEGSASRFQKTGSHHFIPDGETVFGITSGGKLGSLRINTEGSYYTIKSITLNKKLPFSFNAVRFILLFAIISGIIAVFTFKLYKPKHDYNKGIVHKTLLFAIVVCMMFTALSSVINVGFETYPFTKPLVTQDEYAQLFDAFMKGRLDLDIPIDKEAYESLDNPYDYSERYEEIKDRNNHFDRAYYKGKLYCYFGVAPVLLIYFPIYFLTGMVPLAGTVSLILTIFATIAIMFALSAALKHYKLSPPKLTLSLAVTALCTSSLIYVLNAHSSMYYNAVISSILFLALTFGFSYTAFDAKTNKKRNIFLVLSALSVVFTVASRPTVTLYCIMLAPLYIDMLFAKKRAVKEKLISLASFGIPILIGAAAIMAYNYARFESPFDFGQNYQLTLLDVSKNKIELSKLFPSIYHYFLQMPTFSGAFPFINITNANLGIYRGYTYLYGSLGAFSFPATLGIFGIGITKPDRQKKFTYISGVLLAVIVAFLDLCLAGVHFRYQADVMFVLAFVGILVLLEISETVSNMNERIQKHGFVIINLVLVTTLAVAFALIFKNEANNLQKTAPDVYMFFDNLFS